MEFSKLAILATILIYLVAMVLIGFYFNKKNTGFSSGDFFLGGRQLHPLVAAMSAEASDMSSYLLMGLPGLAYLCGVAEVSWTIIGLAVGTYLNWLFVARKIRHYSEHIKAITIPDYFSKRFHDEKHTLSLIAALVILIFFVPYTASGFKAVGTLFNSLFGWNYHVSMLIGAAVIIGYTVLGGFAAVSTTDLIQSIFMTIALVVIVFFGIAQAGGIGAVAANAASLPGYLNVFKGYDAASGSAGSFGFFSVCTTLAWGLGYFGMPHILLRFMAIRNEEEVALSRRIASVWVVFSMFIAMFIGIIGLGVSAAGKIPYLTTSSEAETVIVKLSDIMGAKGAVFAIIAGIILAGILAATMSTADSQLLAASSSVSQDLMQDYFGVKLDGKQSLGIARLTVVIIAIIGVVLAWNPDSSVFRVVSFAWAGFGAAFGPVVLLSLYWKKSNKQGALAGMLVGAVMVFVWKFGIAKLGGAFAIYELLPAFICNLVVMFIVSNVTGGADKAVQDEFDAANA